MATKGMTVMQQGTEEFTINDPNIADEFSSSTGYVKGDFVYYQGNLYVFNTDHSAGAWNSSHVTVVKLANRTADLESKTADLDELMIPETYQNEYSSSGYNVVSYSLKKGEKYIFTLQSVGNDVGIFTNNSGAMGTLLLDLHTTSTKTTDRKEYIAGENCSNIIIYRDHATQMDITIEEAKIPQKVDILNDYIVDYPFEKQYISSGYNQSGYSIQKDRKYIFTLESAGNDVGIYKNNNGSLGDLIIDLHTTATNTTNKREYVSSIDATNLLIYRDSSTQCTVKIEEIKIPEKVNRLEAKVDNLEREVSAPTIVTVKKDGTGDFTTLKGAINYITEKADASVTNPYEIQIHEGTYDVFADYTDEEIAASYGPYYDASGVFPGPMLDNCVSLVGVGNRDRIILKGELDPEEWSYEDYLHNISTLNKRGNGYIENVTITAKYLRYCVHDDFSFNASGTVERKVRNVKFYPEITAHNPHTSWGAGMAGGAFHALFEDCDFGGVFGLHSNAGRNPSEVVIKNCTGWRANFTNMESVINNVYMYGCKFNEVEIWDETESHTQYTFIHGSGNENAIIAVPSGFVYETGSVSKIAKMNLNVGNIVRIKPQRLENGTIQGGIVYELTSNPDLAYGIVIGEDSEYTYIQRCGYITSLILNSISGVNIGDYLTVNNNGEIVTGGTAANAVAIVEQVDSNNVAFYKLLFR